MKQYPIIMQPESIAGIEKQWAYQNELHEFIEDFRKRGANTEFIRAMQKWAETEEMPGFAGRKIESRRLSGLKGINENPNDWDFGGFDTNADVVRNGEHKVLKGYSAIFFNKTEEDFCWHIRSPYGQHGDDLWVREIWQWQDGHLGSGCYIHKFGYEGNPGDVWKSPLFMPKEAARIILINEGISVERLHALTDEAAKREGIVQVQDGNVVTDLNQIPSYLYAKKWIQMHGQASWDSNPWVWVIKFSVKEFKTK